MDPEHRRFLRKKFDAQSWPRAKSTVSPRKTLNLQDLKIPNAELVKFSKKGRQKRPQVHAIWRLNDDPECVIAVDVFTCASADATHDGLLELLGTIQSGDVVRGADSDMVGDIGFFLHDTMHLFASGNIVVMIRNAGRHVVSIRRISEIVSRFIEGP